MDIEQLLSKTLEKGGEVFSNTISEFVSMLQDRIKVYELQENLKNKYDKILEKNEHIEYNVFAKITGKDYTILSFENKGEKIIKVPNIFLPKEINSRTVLNYKNGKFKINQEKTEIKNKQWKEIQKKEEILKEGRIYFVDNHKNDYTQVISVDNGKIYKFNFMQPYIGHRLRMEVNEGEYIIARDGKFEKIDKKVKIQNDSVKEKIEKRIQQIENVRLNEEKNIKETVEIKEKKFDNYKVKKGEIYIVSGLLEDRIRIFNIKDNIELTVKKEEGINLNIGDFIKTKSVGYEKYDKEINIENKIIKENLYNLYNFVL